MRTYKIHEQKEAGMLVRMLVESIKGDTQLQIGIPGGRSILPVLEAFKNLGKQTAQRCRFYLVDERVAEDRNQDMLRETFFNQAIKERLFTKEQLIFPLFTGDVEQDMKKYEAELPEKFDFLIFGVGEDGHIASLFPESEQLETKEKTYHVTNSPKAPSERITLTFKAFNEDATVVLLVLGKEKKEALKRMTQEDYTICPAAYFVQSEQTHLITDNDLP